MSTNSTKKAFTLVELLVVISIISLLMAVLMPALAKARNQGKRIYCLSNLRQLGIAAVNYAVANDDYYPVAHYWQGNEAEFYLHNWDFTQVWSGSDSKVIPGLLWQGDTIEKVQQCPSYKGSSNTAADPFTGYNYNTSYLGHGQDETVSSSYSGLVINNPWYPAQKIVMSEKAIKIRNPEDCAVFGDGHWSGGANKFMRSPFHWEGDYDFLIRKGGTQGFRHDGFTNVLYADGHTDSQKQFYTTSITQVKRGIERYNETTKDFKIGFLSEDNSIYDIR